MRSGIIAESSPREQAGNFSGEKFLGSVGVFVEGLPVFQYSALAVTWGKIKNFYTNDD